VGQLCQFNQAIKQGELQAPSPESGPRDGLQDRAGNRLPYL
jgi:hypothetical protein